VVRHLEVVLQRLGGLLHLVVAVPQVLPVDPHLEEGFPKVLVDPHLEEALPKLVVHLLLVEVLEHQQEDRHPLAVQKLAAARLLATLRFRNQERIVYVMKCWFMLHTSMHYRYESACTTKANRMSAVTLVAEPVDLHSKKDENGVAGPLLIFFMVVVRIVLLVAHSQSSNQ
jgi:hypothetical protein